MKSFAIAFKFLSFIYRMTLSTFFFNRGNSLFFPAQLLARVLVSH